MADTRGLVADQVNLRRAKAVDALNLPVDVLRRDLGPKDVNVGAPRRVGPLVEHGHGCKNQRIASNSRRRLDQAEHLDRLAEAHFVADNPARRQLRLALKHPVDADDLVGLVGKVGPEGLGHGCFQEVKNGGRAWPLNFTFSLSLN